MRINTLSRKKILYSFLFFVFFGFTNASYSQCPTVVSPQTFCDIQFFPSSPTIANLVATDNGGGIVWYATAISTTPLLNGAGLVSGQTYFADDNSGACGVRQSVTVTVYGRPDAQSFQGPCVDFSSQATVSQLQAVGNNVQWYSTPSGGSPLLPTTVLVDNAFYYCSQTNPFTGCETSRRPVQANVGLVPVPTGAPIQFFCNDPSDPPTLEDVVASGNNNWYPTISSTIPIDSTTPLVSGQSYFATTVDLPCESAARLEVQTVLIEPGNPGVNAVKRICVNDLPTFPEFNLFEELTGGPDSTGTWSGPLTTSGGNLGTVNVSTLTLAGSPYTFRYTVSSAPCPDVESTVTIIILPLPTASISTTNSNICFGRNGVVNFTGTPGATVTYSTGSAPDQTVTLDGSGVFALNTPFLTLNTTYTLISVSSSGVPSCTTPASGSVSFTVVALPIVNVTSLPVCSGINATVSATPIGINFSYAWTVPTGATNPGNVASFSTTIPGNYSVIVTNLTTTCPSNSVSVDVVINPLPTVSVSVNNSPICPGQTAAITAVPGVAGTYSYAWTVPVGVTPPGNVPAFNTTIAGTYSVIITNTLTSCVSTSSSGTLTISPLPTVTVSSLPVCVGSNATVTAAPGTPGTYSYVWTVPLGATNPGNVFTFPTSVAGLYSVVMTNTVSNCQSAIANVTVVINVLPTVTVSSPPVCSGLTATVTATPGIAGNYSYAWTVPVGATPPGNVATFTTNVPGNYSVIITNITTTCPSASASTLVTINPLPIVTVSIVNPTICPGDIATVTAIPSVVGTYTYTWTVPAGVTAPGNVATFTTSIAGTYSVIITDTTTNCVSIIASSDLIINPIPTVIVDAPPVCVGTNATVTAIPGVPGTYSYVWTIPAGATDPGNVATFTTSIEGPYSVVITNTVTNCVSASATGDVVINPIPTVTASSSPVCSGINATVTAVPGIAGNYTYVWTVPAGATNPGNVATFSTAVAGVYSVIITDTTTNCPSVSALVTVVINLTPTVTVTSTSTCANGTATVTAIPGVAGNYSYIWTVPSGMSDPGDVTTFTTTVAGTYSVQITDLTTTCVSTTAGTVTLNPLPTVSVNNPSVCPGSDAIIIATPGVSGNYSYSWTVPVGATPPGDVATFSTSVLGTYSVVITDIITTCQSISASGTIISSPLPTVSVNDASVCSGTNATITASPGSGLSTDYSYVWTVPSGAALPGNVVSFTTSTAGVYSVVITNIVTTCVSDSASGTVVINPTPTVTVSTPAVCFGDSSTITATPGIPGNYTYVWTIPSGVSDPGSVPSFLATIAGSYSVVITDTTTNCISLSVSSTLLVNPLPTATVSSSGTVCSGSTASILFTGTPNSNVTYNINNNGNLQIPIGASGIATLNIPLLITSTFNLVSVTLANPPSCSQNLSGSTTLNVIQPPVAGSNAAITLCSNGASQDLFLLLGGSPQPGGTWSGPGGVGLASGSGVFDPTIDPAGNYIYTVAGTPPCVNDTSLVTVTIIPKANAGIGSERNLCSNQDPVDLFSYLSGSPQLGGTWSPVLASGTGIFNPSVDIGGNYTYTVNGTTPCGNDQAIVTINITLGPNAGSPGAVTLCLNSPPVNLFPSLGPLAELGGTWAPALNSGTDLFDPAIDLAGVYTYTLSGNQPCDNDSAAITVIVNPLPNAGDDDTRPICSNSNPVDLLPLLGPNAQNGGTWSPLLASGTNIFNPAIDLGGTYTYTVGNPFCDPDSAFLTINITQGPDAGIPGSITFCIANTAQDLFLSLGGSPQPGGSWTPTLTSGTGIFDPAIDVQGVYTYTLSGNQPCDNDTATVTVTVDPLPNAGNFVGNQDVCTSQGTFDLFSLLTGNQAGGLWTDSTNTTVTSTIDIAAFTPNTYNYTYTVTNSCLPADSETVQFTVLTNPVLDAGNIAVSSPNCSGDNVAVTFTNMIDGSYILNYNLSLANIVTNQNAPVSIVGGTGILTISTNDIPNVGTTRITFLNITNATTTCTTAINPNVSADFIIQPSSNLESTNLSTNTVCQGEDAIIDISGASGLVDGDYQFIYSIPNGTPVIGTTAITTISNGNGQFTIPNSVIANVGNFNLTITSIVSLTGGCNNLNENASISIDVFAIPDLSNAILLANEACVNFSNEVTITNELNEILTDGSYVITYELSGVSTATHIDTVTITNNNGTFTIPATDLNTVGNVTVTITQIESVLGGCSANVIGIDPITFEVTEIATPILLPKGNEFCISDIPTISNLTSNISGTLSVTWYNAPIGGSAYTSTDLLINNTTYFAAYVSAAGCESVTRLPVTVDLTRCEDILIPDGFSPNDDGVNDYFVIKDLEIAYPRYTLEIYNRYGNVLYKGNINTPNWNGTTTVGGIKLGNNIVPVGVYFYILEFNDGERKAKQGRLYLSR